MLNIYFLKFSHKIFHFKNKSQTRAIPFRNLFTPFQNLLQQNNVSVLKKYIHRNSIIANKKKLFEF